jgi:hypothetical protein
MNIEEWADYWHSAGADIVFISVTGILAFYPSKVQFHRHGKFLVAVTSSVGVAAARAGMRVVARMSRTELGRCPCRPSGGPCATPTNRFSSVAKTSACSAPACSPAMDDYVPAIMREINSLCDVVCFCNGAPATVCRAAAPSVANCAATLAFWRFQ